MNRSAYICLIVLAFLTSCCFAENDVKPFEVSRYFTHLVSLDALDAADISPPGHMTWTPDGTKVVMYHSLRGGGGEMKGLFVIDIDSKNFVVYREEDREEKGLDSPKHEATDGGKIVTIPNRDRESRLPFEYLRAIPTSSGFVGIQRFGKDADSNHISTGYERMVFVPFDFSESRELLPIVRNQNLYIEDTEGYNSLVRRQIKGQREMFLHSAENGKLTRIANEHIEYDMFVSAKKEPIAVILDKDAVRLTFLPVKRFGTDIQFDKKTIVKDMVFCNHDRWLCCLTTNNKSFSLEFFEVATSKRVQVIDVRNAERSVEWYSVQSNIEGNTLYVPADQALFDWKGSRFEKVADIATPGIRDVFLANHVENCSMSPDGKRIALRLRKKERSEGDSRRGDYWLLETNAFRDAANALDKERADSKLPMPTMSLAERPPAAIPFELRKPYHPADLLVRWDLRGYSGHRDEDPMEIVGDDRWIAIQVGGRTLVYDLWSDRSFNLNQLAWDHYRIHRGFYRGEADLLGSRTFSVCPDRNRIVVVGQFSVQLWNLSGRSPVLEQNAQFPTSLQGQESPFEKILHSEYSEVRCLKHVGNSEGQRLLFSNGNGFAVANLERSEITEVGLLSDPLHMATFSDDHQKLFALNPRNSSSEETEMRVYRLHPDVAGEEIRVLPSSILAISSPYKDQILLKGRYSADGLFFGNASQSKEQMTHLSINCGNCIFQPATSQWVIVDGEPPKNSTRLHLLSEVFEPKGSMTIPRLDRHDIQGLAITSDSKHLAISCSDDDSVILIPSHWKSTER